MTSMGEVPCATCGGSQSDHVDRIHPYTVPGSIPTRNVFARTRQEGPESERLPFDPVLRQALMDKGIITREDLRAADERVQALVGRIGGVGDGDGSQPR